MKLEQCNVMYAQPKNNTVFQLLALNYGIALKNLVQIAKLVTILRKIQIFLNSLL